jgi:hypothetical protein
MRWLMIVLLLSLTGMLFAAGGLVRHVWLQRRRAADARAAEDSADDSTDKDSTTQQH